MLDMDMIPCSTYVLSVFQSILGFIGYEDYFHRSVPPLDI